MTSVLSRHDQGLDQPCQTADAAFERLYAEHSDRILAYCLGRLPARAEAEDAVQLTFLYALRALRRGVVPEHESGWLHAIAKNVCRWQLRTAARRPIGDGHGVELLAGPEVDHEDGELVAGLSEALESIPERQRRALLLREWRGLSAPEIAEHLDLSTPATHALLTRARQSLQQALVASKRAALGVGSLAFELRSWLKGLVSATSVKAGAGAVATVVVIGGAGGAGVSVDRSLASPGSNQSAFAREEASVEPVASGVPGKGGGGDRTGDARVRGVETGPTGTFGRLAGRPEPVLTPWIPGGEPAPEPVPGAEPTPGPAPEADLPGVEPTPTEAIDLPPVDPPPLDPPVVDPPPVDLPPIDPPPIDVPTVDLPGDVLPPVDVPTVDLPAVDLPSVDLPPVDPPPIDLPSLGD